MADFFEIFNTLFRLFLKKHLFTLNSAIFLPLKNMLNDILATSLSSVCSFNSIQVSALFLF